jgi:hypothetical protein
MGLRKKWLQHLKPIMATPHRYFNNQRGDLAAVNS